jgi:hypothetical protein
LRMPALTTARTTAFIPALSPPEVRTASFIARLLMSGLTQGPHDVIYGRRKAGVGVGNYGIAPVYELRVMAWGERLDKIHG